MVRIVRLLTTADAFVMLTSLFSVIITMFAKTASVSLSDPNLFLPESAQAIWLAKRIRARQDIDSYLVILASRRTIMHSISQSQRIVPRVCSEIELQGSVLIFVLFISPTCSWKCDASVGKLHLRLWILTTPVIYLRPSSSFPNKSLDIGTSQNRA